MSATRIDSSAIVALLNIRMPGVTDQIAKICPLFDQLNKNGRVQYGRGWNTGKSWFVHTKNSHLASVGSVSDQMNVQAMAADDKIEVSVPGSNLAHGIAQSEMLRRRLANINDKELMFDLLAEDVAAATAALVQTLCSDLYADGTQRSTQPGPAPIVGLAGIVDDDNTYATVNRSTSGNDYWKALVKACPTQFNAEGGVQAGTKDGIAWMRRVWNAITTTGAANPANKTADGISNKGEMLDAIFTDTFGFEQYESSHDSRTRFDGANNRDAGGAVTTSLFKLKPLYLDPFCGANVMFFVQYASIFLETVEPSPKLFSVYAEDKTGLLQGITMAGQHLLYCKKPRVQGRLDLTTETA